MNIVQENLGWLEYTYEKLGNQISLIPLGYEKLEVAKTSKSFGSKNKAILWLNVTNHGLSDQIHDDIKIRIDNINMRVDPSYSPRKDSNAQIMAESDAKVDYGTDYLGFQPKKHNFVYLNNLKKRTSQIL